VAEVYRKRTSPSAQIGSRAENLSRCFGAGEFAAKVVENAQRLPVLRRIAGRRDAFLRVNA
jgi:hypothetical protein